MGNLAKSDIDSIVDQETGAAAASAAQDDADAAQVDATEALAQIAALTEASPFVVDEYTNPAAADATALMAATATSLSVVQVLAAGLLSGGKNALLDCPRQLVFSTAGGTPSDAPASVDIVGTGWDDEALSETLALAQTETTATSVNFYKTIVSLDYLVGQGTDATVAVGFGATLGLKHKAKTRTTIVNVIKELYDGTVVTNGTFATAAGAPPFGSYAPNTAANGTHDYCVTFEQDIA